MMMMMMKDKRKGEKERINTRNLVGVTKNNVLGRVINYYIFIFFSKYFVAERIFK
jgi:hypothetical protein